MKVWAALIFVLSTAVALPGYAEPALKDDGLVVQKFVPDICCSPTTMVFVGEDILVLQRTDGQVRLIKDGVPQEKPILDENVDGAGEQGMLGITTVGKKVYLYFTESTRDDAPALGKRVYSYDWNGQELVNKILVRDLPQTNTYHNGGAMTTGLDGSVYLIVGDAGRYGKLQNHPEGEPDDTSVILRIDPPGPYYAVGIRNSFGLAVDPLTGVLWDTENGPENFDEINLVPPNFNSGWDVIMGPADETWLAKLPGYPGYVYRDPQFSWEVPVAPTGLTFINSEHFEKYRNSIFAVDCINGNLYRFELNQNRDGFVFNSSELMDAVANEGESMDEIIFGTGFGCATDIKVGPDGFLYIVSHSDGVIYRMLPKAMAVDTIPGIGSAYVQYLVYAVIAAAVISSLVYLKRIGKV